MARQKQSVPLQRAPSSEIMQSPPDLPDVSRRPLNGSPGRPENVVPEKRPAVAAPSDTPGVLQLIICVAGIYASLYGALSILHICYSPYDVLHAWLID